MNIEIEIENYDKNKGLQLIWENGFVLDVKNKNGQVVISGNREGLTSLARHLLAMAMDGVEEGAHIHLDEYNSLENGSTELVIEKLA